MNNDHLRRRLRRRLLPAAVAAVTIAASAPLVLPHSARADGAPPPPRVAVAQPAGKIPTLPRVSATRAMRAQGTSAT
jgi:hypothetical protein